MTPRSPRRLLVERAQWQIEAFAHGDGDDTVILASGNGRPAAELDRLAADLADTGLRAITYNYRGIGASTGPISGLTLHDFADDVWALADKFDARRVHLVGKSFGNRVMRAAASVRPHRCGSIVLAGPGGATPPSEETQELYRRYLDRTVFGEERTALIAALMYAPGNQHLATDEASPDIDADVARTQIEASDATPPEEWEGGGTAPMLIIVGLQDRVAPPANGLAIATERPESWLIGLPTCGHNMVDEQPEALSRFVAEFVGRHRR